MPGPRGSFIAGVQAAVFRGPDHDGRAIFRVSSREGGTGRAELNRATALALAQFVSVPDGVTTKWKLASAAPDW